MAKKLRYKCFVCGEKFKSWQSRDRHMEENHKPPAPPVKREKKFIRTGESHRLCGGTDIKLGENVTFIKKVVVTKVCLTEGSDVAEVEVSVIRDNWERS